MIGEVVEHPRVCIAHDSRLEAEADIITGCCLAMMADPKPNVPTVAAG
jgi:hypothetical protein